MCIVFSTNIFFLSPYFFVLGEKEKSRNSSPLSFECNPAQHVSKLLFICHMGDHDYGVAVELSHSVSQPFTIWFTGLIHLERSYTGNKPIFEFEELSTALLYLDQGKQHKALQDHKLLFA